MDQTALKLSNMSLKFETSEIKAHPVVWISSAVDKEYRQVELTEENNARSNLKPPAANRIE